MCIKLITSWKTNNSWNASLVLTGYVLKQTTTYTRLEVLQWILKRCKIVWCQLKSTNIDYTHLRHIVLDFNTYARHHFAYHSQIMFVFVIAICLNITSWIVIPKKCTYRIKFIRFFTYMTYSALIIVVLD